MASTYLYLDVRHLTVAGRHLLKLAVSHRRVVRYFSLDIYLASGQWDAKNCRVTSAHPLHKKLNTLIARHLLDAEAALLDVRLSLGGRAVLDDYYNAVGEALGKITKEQLTFVARFLSFANAKKQSTQGVYLQTLSRIRAFAPGCEALRFEDVTFDWLTAFESYLARTAPSKNARNIHLRNIRAVFNAAIDDGITTAYPFRRFKIRPVATAKRSLSVVQLRELIGCAVEPWQERYRDAFVLIFMLCGINAVDLCRLRSVVDGRVEYHRAKTGRFYSVKVEPEAQALLDKYRGERWLLPMLDRFADHRDWVKHLNRALQSIGSCERVGRGGRKIVQPLFPGLTSYWARHTWATVAASLEIPKETIAAALGHGGNSVTDIYIDFDRRKVDEANRRVLDWVLYGKR